MDTISITRSEVPTYLRSGEFYRSLSDDEDHAQQIAIPSNTLKVDIAVQNNADLHHLLTSLRFWGVSSIQDEVIKYCLSELDFPCDDILQEFAQDFPYVTALISVLTANEEETAKMAVKSGMLEIVRNLPRNLTIDDGCCCAAARAGNLDILQCLHERGGALNCIALRAALEGGDKSLACVQYLREREIEWPYNALVTALKAGSKECFHYALQDGCVWADDACIYLIQDQYVEALKYATQHGYPINKCSVSMTAGRGAIKCLQVLHEANCPWDEGACMRAARYGHLDCLMYLHESGCPWDEFTVSWAVENDHMGCVQYALQQGCPVSWRSCSCAAREGYLPILRYLHGEGVAWNEGTCAAAAANGHLDCLVYLHENGCPWDKDTVYEAVENNHIECVQYALQQGCLVSSRSCTIAAQKGYLSMLQSLHEAGAPWDEENAFYQTLKSGKLECLKYLLENGSPVDLTRCQELIVQGICSQEAVELVRSLFPHL